MQKSFFGRHALLVLIIVYFSIPFALRGSRYAVQRMKNDVKDWLPADFPETRELDEFRKHFLGEQFVVISWDGCVGAHDDIRFQKFVDGLYPELPPSVVRAEAERKRKNGVPNSDPNYVDKNLELYTRSFVPDSAVKDESFIGNRLSLKYMPEDHYDWGGQQEKWLRSGKSNWVYITPKGDLYQWTGNQTWPAQLWRSIVRGATGQKTVGRPELVASLGIVDGAWYYEDPSRLNAHLIKSVTSGPSVLSQLTESKIGIDRTEAHERLRGVLFGSDDEQTCIVVTLTDAAKEDPRALVGRGILGRERGFLLDVADEAGVQAPRPPPSLPGIFAGLFPAEEVSADPMLRLGGPPVDNAAIDEEGQITLVRLLGLSLAVGLGLSWLCFRSINITIMVFLVGGFSAIVSVGIIYWTGSQLDAVLMSMPSLVYVLGISGAVHVVNYYRESVGEHGMATAPDRAVKLGFWPCTMAAFTTSLGLLSLATSNITPIRKFGCYAAVGVFATLILLFTYLPAALEMWPPKAYLKRNKTSGENATPASAIERFLDSFWQAVGRFVISHYSLVKWACLALLLVGVVGLTKINTTVQLLKLFDGNAKIIEDYEWLEAKLGKLVPMELVVRVDKSVIDPSGIGVELEEAVKNAEEIFAEPPIQGMNFLERMEISKYVASEVDLLYGETGTRSMSRPMSANTFAREMERGFILDRARNKLSTETEESRQEFVDAGFLRIDPKDESELWRVSLRLAALDDIDFGSFVQNVQRVVEPIMFAYECREEVILDPKIKKQLANRDADAPGVWFIAEPETLAQPKPKDKDLADAPPNIDDVSVDQSIIFTRTLVRLLKNEGFQIEGAITDPVDLAKVGENDAVVILDVIEGVTSTALKENGITSFLPAQNHEFDPHTEATSTANKTNQNVSVVYTGLVPIVYKAQRTLLKSLIHSTGLAFLMIAVVMVLLLRSPKAGMVAMLPNVFPVVAIFGFMGWRGTLVDIGSMMTASVAMGVAVDDTIHFLSWFRRGLDDGYSRNDAILLAYRRVATAMTQTTAIGGIGLSIFAFSTFTPTQMFGTLMLAMLAAALVGDLLFLPALLASPLGKMFDKKKETSESSEKSNTARPHVEGANSNGNGSRRPAMLPPTARRDKEH